MFDEPAYLLADGGVVVLANPAARESHTEPPGWLRGLGADLAEELPSGRFRARRLHVDGEHRWLVVLGAEESERVRRLVADIEALSPRYREVVALLLEGLTDKEIAARLELAPSSSRAYAARIYAKLGVRGRVELLAYAAKARLL